LEARSFQGLSCLKSNPYKTQAPQRKTFIVHLDVDMDTSWYILREHLRPKPFEDHKKPLYPKQATYSDRIATFNKFNWPRHIRPTPHTLAEAGMFYTALADAVLCFHCGRGFYKWDPEDDPYYEHAIHFPKCYFLELKKGWVFIKRIQYSKRPYEEVKLQSEESREDLPEGKYCLICTITERQIAFLPCGHFVACVECSLVLTECCVCRTSITDRQRIYAS